LRNGLDGWKIGVHVPLVDLWLVDSLGFSQSKSTEGVLE